MREIVFLSLRYLLRGKKRHISLISVLSTIGITIGVATLIVVMSVMNGFDKELMDKLLKFNYHLIVESHGNKSELKKIKGRISKMKGVERASIFYQTQVFLKTDNYIYPVIVKGLDFKDVEERKSFSKFVKKKFSQEGFFVGENLFHRLGEKKEILFYPLRKPPRLEKRKIKGVFKVGLYDVDNYIITDLREIEEVGENFLSFLGVKVRNPFEVEKIKNKIKSIHPFPSYSWIDMNRALFTALRLEKLTMFFILSLIIVVATFSILSLLWIKVVEKTKEIGILKAIGFTPLKILSIFTIQGISLGMLGTGAGLSLGIFLCYLIKEYKIIHLPESIYYINYLPVYIDYRDILVVVGATFLLSFLSSIFPAIKAAKLEPQEALRYE